MRSKASIGLMFAATLVAATPALAHTGLGIGGGLAAGIVHPFLGADHALAMLSVGALAAVAGGRALWALPVTFMALMAAGAALALSGVALPAAEQGIALSLIVFGALLATRVGLQTLAAMALVGVFAVFHGHAHGNELPALANPLAYGLGFVAATGLLHAAGIVLARAVPAAIGRLGVPALRLAGGAVATLGLAMMVG